MKIENLELTNFRNHEKSFMVFDLVNFFIGKNNAGKTSVKGALELAITGENEWTPGGKYAKDLIKHGEKEGSVEVEIETMGTLKRVIKERGSYVELNSSKISDKEVQKEILDEFGLSYDALSCAINSSKFMNMKPNEQKDFLFRLTSAVLTPHYIISYMDNPSDAAKDIVLDALPTNVSIEVLDKTYNEFFVTRKNVKKDSANLKAKLDAIGTIPASSGVDIAAVNKELENLNMKREDVLKKIAVIDEQVKQRDRLSSYIEKAEQKIEDLKKKIDPNVNLAEAEETIFGYVTEINEANKELEKHKAIYNVLKSQNKNLNDIIKKVSTSVCPLSDKIVCNTDKTFLISDLEKQVEDNEKQIATAESNINLLNTKIDDLKKKKDNLKLQIKLANELDEQTEQKKQLTKDLKSIKVQDKTALNSEMEQYQDEIKKLKDLQNVHNEWVKTKENYDKLVVEYEKSVDMVNLYEYLVREFSPKGIKARVLEKIIFPIQDYCNKTLSILTNGVYKIKFSFDDNFDILVENKSGIMNLNALSNSEKLRIGIILQDAINNLTNAKILFVDDAEILDQENTKLFLELIDHIKGNYESIFIIATNEDKGVASTLKQIQGSKVFFVEDGNINEI